MKELKKEWERDYQNIWSNIDTIENWSWIKLELKDFISSLLAKQQEEFVKMIESKIHWTDGEELLADDTVARNNTLDDLLADIKSKLNKTNETN